MYGVSLVLLADWQFTMLASRNVFVRDKVIKGTAVHSLRHLYYLYRLVLYDDYLANIVHVRCSSVERLL